MAVFADISNMLASLSLQEGWTVLEPMIVFIVGMVIYSIFIFKFYNFISRKSIFTFTGGKYSEHAGLKKFAYSIEYLFLFPIVAFIWFFVISLILTMVSGSIAISSVFLISMSVLATIRFTAYYNENLSKDIAKLLPLSLLAILLFDISNISLITPFDVIIELIDVGRTLIYYFGFIFAVEIFLKMISHNTSKSTKQPKLKASDVADEERNF